MKTLIATRLARWGLVALIGLAGVANAQQNVTLKTSKVRDNIYMIEGANGFAGGNIAVSVGSDGLLMVDALVPGMTDKLKASLKELGKGKLRYVLNTHWHGDHTGGNQILASTAPVVAHNNVRLRMMKDQENYFGKAPASPKAALPVITYKDKMTFYFNDDTIEVRHYPMGHTDGDSMVYFSNARVLHMGDEYFNGMYPFVDLSTGGSVIGLRDNLAKVLKEIPDDVLIVPGHGPIANKKDLKGYHKMIDRSIKIVEKAMAAKQSLAAIQKTGLGKELAPWGKGFIPEKDWISFVYHSIQHANDREHTHDAKTGHMHHH